LLVNLWLLLMQKVTWPRQLMLLPAPLTTEVSPTRKKRVGPVYGSSVFINLNEGKSIRGDLS
jgi:hypothetical protein